MKNVIIFSIFLFLTTNYGHAQEGPFGVPILDNSNCNLVPNYGFDLINCSNSTISCHNTPEMCIGLDTNNITPGLTDGWYNFNATPDIEIVDQTGPCPINLGDTPWHLDNPAHFVRAVGTTDLASEGLMTAVNLKPNTNYIASHFIALQNDNIGQGDYEVGLVQNQASIPNFLDPIAMTATSVDYIALGFNRTPIHQRAIRSNIWNQNVIRFTTDNVSYNFYYFWSHGETQSTFVLDNVELIEDLFPTADENITFDCQETITIGEDLCSINGLEYIWFDATDDTNLLQLTQNDGFGNITLSSPVDSGGNPIGLTSSENGTELVISPNVNTIYRLLRQFKGTRAINPLTNAEITEGTDTNEDGQSIVAFDIDNQTDIGDLSEVIDASVDYIINVACLDECPVASFDYTLDECGSITLTDNSILNGGTIINWAWHIGDDDLLIDLTANGAMATFSNLPTNTYTVTFTITSLDASGNSCSRDTISQTVFIETCEDPTDPCDIEELNVNIDGNNLVWNDLATSYHLEFYSDGTCCQENGTSLSASFTTTDTFFDVTQVITIIRAKCFRFRIRTDCSDWSNWCCLVPVSSMQYSLINDCVPSNPCDNYQDHINIVTTIVSGTTVNYITYVDITASNIIESGANATYKASNSIVLQPGFHAEDGAIFWAYIDPCDSNPLLVNQDTSENKENSTPKQPNNNEVVVYPNPTKGLINMVHLNQKIKAYQLYNMQGQQVLSRLAINSFNHTVDISELSNGFYILKITLADGTISNKSIILNQ